jgi:hypothetical protein
MTIFGIKKFYNSLKIGPNFFLQQFKHKISFSFVKFVATKQGMTTIFFRPSLLLLFLDPGSGIRNPGSGMGKNQDPGSGINIPDPQHWIQDQGWRMKMVLILFHGQCWRVRG